MCGIAGAYFFEGAKIPAQIDSTMRRMVGMLHHRGPDSEGFLLRPHLAMGMRRLRVVDLDTGDQPIANPANKTWIIFNGEIYNHVALRKELQAQGHVFKTRSDTEVILKLYDAEGTRCVRRLNGMYAFTVYDERDGSLFLARDPLGIKPLYYYQDQEKFLFASQIKAILAFPGVPRVLDQEALGHFLSLNYLSSPWTLFAGIRQLEGGHCLHIHRNGPAQPQRFWPIPGSLDMSLTEQDVIVRTRELLEKSVQSQLVADVPVGAFLSGGLDSSSLVALIRRSHASELNTFSVGFQEASYDETRHARLVAKKFGTTHHEVILRAGDVPGLLEKLVEQLDQPLADPAALALYPLSELARKHVTVALSGDGSDEIFVGYATYHANRYLRWYQQLPEFIRARWIAPLVSGLPASTEKFSFDYRAKKFLEGSRFDPQKAHYWWRTVLVGEERRNVLRPEFRQAIADADSFAIYKKYFQEVQHLDFTSQCLWADLRVWLAGNNLHKVDAMSMAHSLEARVPYLDQELVEFLLRVPPAIKFKANQSKFLLKKAMKGLLPKEIMHRRKAGWHLPFAHWFRYDLKDFLSQRLGSGNGRFFEIFEPAQVQRILGEHFRGQQNHSYKIWAFLVLQGWFEQYKTLIDFSPAVGRENISDSQNNKMLSHSS